MKQKIKSLIKRAPDNKVYIEVITALLTVPVMLTVLITNYNNLTTKKTTSEAVSAVPTKTQEVIIKTIPGNNNSQAQTPPQIANQAQSPATPTPIPTTGTTQCQKSVGPVTISYPTEGETVSDNPLTIIINHDDNDYCAVVWSYSINGGPWSNYSSNSISLYDMPNGSKQLELRVQSTVSNDQTLLTRNFTYTGATNNSASPSAH